MKKLNKFRKSAVTVTALAFLIGVGASSVSAAPPAPQSKDAEITIEAGELSYTAPNIVSFGTVKLADTKQTVTTEFDGPVVISDARGSGEGWKLGLSATVFKTTINGSDHTLPTGKLRIKQPTSLTNSSGVNTGLNNLVTTSDVVIDGVGTVNIASASVNNGKGITNVAFPTLDSLSLEIDPNDILVDKTAKTSKYTAVLTWSLTEAP